MKRLDPSTFLEQTLAELDDLPPSFAQQLVPLVGSTPSSRWERIRNLIMRATRA